MPPLTTPTQLLVNNPLTTYTVASSTDTTTSGQAISIRQPVGGPGYMGVILIHGILGTGASAMADPVLTKVATRLAQVGFPVISGDMRAAGDPDDYAGAGDGWGSDYTLAKMQENVTYLEGTLGADDTYGHAVVGLSAGGPTGLIWAYEEPSLVSCYAGIAPCLDTQDLYDLGDSWPSSINAAFSSPRGNIADPTGWDAAEPTKNPWNVPPVGCRTHIWYGTADEFMPAANVAPFVAAIGSTAGSTPWVGEHGDYTTVNAYQIANFIINSYPPTAITRQTLLWMLGSTITAVEGDTELRLTFLLTDAYRTINLQDATAVVLHMNTETAATTVLPTPGFCTVVLPADFTATIGHFDAELLMTLDGNDWFFPSERALYVEILPHTRARA